MVNVDEIYGQSEYFKASDLPPKIVKYKIVDVYMREFYQNGQTTVKLVLVLDGVKKHFIVNRTNASILSSILGKETDAWREKEITLAKRLIKASDGSDIFTIVVQRPTAKAE
ncbi:MAG: hypothetical protein QW292_04625 [Candidatus Parvarchaeota archaeon]